VWWSIDEKEKPAVNSPFFGAFHCDCIPKATKDVSAAIPVNYTSEFRELFESASSTVV
jgi:hypothetical protein